MVRCVAVCCSVLQCVAVCCSMLHYVAGCGRLVPAQEWRNRTLGCHKQLKWNKMCFTQMIWVQRQPTPPHWISFTEIIFEILSKYLVQLCKYPGGGNFEKNSDPEIKNRNRRKSRENAFGFAKKITWECFRFCKNGQRRIHDEFLLVPPNGFTLLGVAGFGRKSLNLERILMQISIRWRG